MKICPKCRQQFPDGFQFCPNDTQFLITREEYLRRIKPVPPRAQSLNFSIPEEGSLISRLIAGFQNIGYIFNGGPQVRTARAGEFQFLLPEESLVKRISREIGNAFIAFKRDPRQFISELVKGEGTNRARRNALLAGSEMAFAGYFTVYFAATALGKIGKVSNSQFKLYFAGFAVYLLTCYLTRGFLLFKLINRASRGFAFPKIALEIFNWGPLITVMLLAYFLNNYSFYCIIFPERCSVEEAPKLDLVMYQALPIEETKIDVKLPEKAKAEKKELGGSKPKPKPATGGGGGGRQQPAPPSKGVPPQMALAPQIIPPSPEPPKIKNPQLVVASTLSGDPKTIPTLKGPIGDPTGIPGPPSSGPGKGGGIGRGSGTGVGIGDGGGLGPGRGGNAGGGDIGLGGGGGVLPMTANLRPIILYTEKPRYTEEARQNKLQGTVVLSVVFSADGRITNIRVVRSLPDGLTENAIAAARRIRFNPAVKDGVPVSVRTNLEFSFNMY
jgi:TonB family protein